MPRPSAAEQARRMLVLVGLLQPESEMSLERLAGTVGASVEQTATDLELLSICGVAPYYPDDLVPLYLDGETVNIFGSMPALDRKVRLSAPEARALAAALQAAGRTATDPLVVRLLDGAGGYDPLEIERLIRTVATTDPDTHATLAVAVTRHETLRVHYHNVSADETTERVVEPLALLDEHGVWYLQAYCRLAGALRTFRGDRIESAELTGERFEPRKVTVPGTAVPAGDLPRARVRFDADAQIPEREWPGMCVAQVADGCTTVEVPYAGTAWIARQVLSYLGSAEVLEPAEVREAVARLAAAEIARIDAGSADA